jgi:hypothetical protein
VESPLGSPLTAPGAPEMFSSLLASMRTGADGAPMMQPPTVLPPPPKTWVDRLLPLVHLVSMIALAFYAVSIWEPTTRLGDPTARGFIDWGGWAALGRRSVSRQEIANVVCILAHRLARLGKVMSSQRHIYSLYSTHLSR